MKESKIKYLRANPDATFEEYQKATGGTKLSFHQTKYVLKKQKETAINIIRSVAEKKPVKKKVAKPRKTLKVVVDERENTIKNLKDEVASVRNALNEFHAENKALNGLIIKMKDDIKMYVAIISYLEHKLGIPDADEL